MSLVGRSRCLPPFGQRAGVGCLFILMRQKPNGPLGRLRWRSQLTHRVQQLAQLQPGVSAEVVAVIMPVALTALAWVSTKIGDKNTTAIFSAVTAIVDAQAKSKKKA